LLRILERDILIYNRCTTKIAKNTPRLFYLANGYALVLGIGFDGIVLWVELPDKWGYAVETHIRYDLETIKWDFFLGTRDKLEVLGIEFHLVDTDNTNLVDV
jgi:hypothetical protein